MGTFDGRVPTSFVVIDGFSSKTRVKNVKCFEHLLRWQEFCFKLFLYCHYLLEYLKVLSVTSF